MLQCVASVETWLRTIGHAHANLIRIMRFRLLDYTWCKRAAAQYGHSEGASAEVEARVREAANGALTLTAQWIAANGEDAGAVDLGLRPEFVGEMWKIERGHGGRLLWTEIKCSLWYACIIGMRGDYIRCRKAAA